MEGDTCVSDYLGFLKELENTGASYFLKGGQAVNFWAEYFTAKGAGETILLFHSKCHCLLGLDQTARQDEKHLRILCQILSEHFADALADVHAGRASQRALINEIKLLLDTLKNQRVKRAIKLIGVASASLIPWEMLASCGLPKVERFAASIRREA